MDAFTYQCACSYPHGPHTLACLSVNDRRLEAQCQVVKEERSEEEALRFWSEGCRAVAVG